MKRRQEASEEGPSKKPHKDTLPWEMRAGMILEVNLRNFMCHEKYRFEPNQRLNFLTGENGSGKSAVLTAIVFGLGGTARMSNRGNSNKGFIRTGQSSAMVEIRLYNVGENAYRPDLYGNAITVQRVVNHSSSTYKLKDSSGKIVTERKVKEELDRMLLTFNIQVDNPIAVLNQDTAKTFLFKCEPDKLYSFFMRATQLEMCKADYNAANDEKMAAYNLLVEKNNGLPVLKKEWEKWAKKYEFHQTLLTRKEDVKKRKAEAAWVAVRDAEEELEEEKAKIEMENKKIPLCDQKIEKHTQDEKLAREQKKNIETEIQGMSKEIDADDARVRELKADFSKKKEVEKKKRKSMGDFNSIVNRKTDEEKQYDDEIKRLRSKGEAEYEERHRQRQAEMKKIEEEREALQAQLDTTTNHNNHLKENKRSTEEELRDTKNELNAQRTKANKTRSEVAGLQKGGDRLAAFGNWMPKLVAEIQKNKKFKTKPIGPLGAYINLKPNVPDNIAKIAEGELGGNVYAFMVETSADQKELYSMFERLRLPFKPSIYTCPFSTNKHDITPHRVNSSEYFAVIDYFEIENATVYNRVVDSVGAERILIIPDDLAAQDMLKNRAKVPRNLMHAMTSKNYQYYPAPDYRSYYKECRARGVLKASLDEIIAELEQQLRAEETAVEALQKLLKEKHEEQNSHNKMIDLEDKKIGAIQKQIREKNIRLVTLKNQDEDEQPPDISALEDDLERCREELEKAKQKIQEAKEELKELAEVTSAAKRAHDQLVEEVGERRERIDPLSQELTKVEAAIKKFRKDKEYYVGKKNEYKAKIAEVERGLATKQSKVDGALERAKVWSEERIESRKKLESLTREIKRLEDSLRVQEETQEPRELVTQKFEKLRDAYAKSKAQIKYMDKTINFLATMLEARKSGYEVILRSTTRNLNRNFTTALNCRQFVGRLNFDHENHTLEIIVNPGSDPKEAKRKLATLSGGEKSFSSVSLVLALWDAMTPPFRILDEFDVFMDAVNRRVSLKLITDYATDDRKYQFVFLTPLNTDNMDVGDDLKIIKLRKSVA